MKRFPLAVLCLFALALPAQACHFGFLRVQSVAVVAPYCAPALVAPVYADPVVQVQAVYVQPVVVQPYAVQQVRVQRVQRVRVQRQVIRQRSFIRGY